MITASLHILSRTLQRLEAKLGLIGASMVLATIFLLAAMLYVQPVFTVAFHGIQFSMLSEHPFDFASPNPLRYRILSPLLGYLVFLRGGSFFLFPLLMTWIFLGTVYYGYRKKNSEPIDAMLLACFIAFSCVILLPLVAPGYTDVTTWLMVFLAFLFRNKIALSASFFALALLNHESAAVLLPGLILYSYEGGKQKLPKILLAFILACIPHLAYRWYVNEYIQTLYDFSFYFSSDNFRFSMTKLVLYLPAAAFYTFKLWWAFPACFMVWGFYSGRVMQATVIALILGGAFSLVCISYDYTRMLTIGFPAVLLSFRWFSEIINREKIRQFAWALILLNFLILQYHVNYDGPQPMFPWILNKVSEHFGIPLV